MAASQSESPLATQPWGLTPSPDLKQKEWDTLLALCDAAIPAIRSAQSSETKRASNALCLPDDAFAATLESIRSSLPPSTSRETAVAFLEDQPSSIPGFKEVLQYTLLMCTPPGELVDLARVLRILGYSAGSLLLTGYATTITAQPLHVREQILQTTTTTSSKSPGKEPEVLQVDVVIVGSGCGGGVAATVLAEAGLRVLVADVGHHWQSDQLPHSDVDGPKRTFMNGGSILSDDSSTAVAAGQTWGGGGAVNWAAALQPQGFVRREWAATGLPSSPPPPSKVGRPRVRRHGRVHRPRRAQQAQRDPVEQRQEARLGARRRAPEQRPGPHTCGHQCTMGCRSSGKKGPAVYWLPRAAAAGAQFMEGFEVKKILFGRGRSKRAKGVYGVWRSRDEHGGVAGKSVVTRQVIVKATRVIVSSGTLQSPLLLARSGLKNPQIGKNLYLHPVSMMGAVYDEQLEPWKGSIISSACSEFENLDGYGYGPKLEPTCTIPWTWTTWLPWTSGEEWKQMAAKMGCTAAWISLTRDKHTGSVYAGPDGRCQIRYHPSSLDKRHIMEGLIALARINYEAGAREIFTTIPGAPTYLRKDSVDDSATGDGFAADPDFEDWLARLRAYGFPSPQSIFVSAHQMGTCRMSSSPKSGVVNTKGEVWGTKNLYVMDASVFPTSTGVNPFVTVMSIADALSREIVAEVSKSKL
ncbi:unnamed protein product [Parascedosporium putredinis]|uniref:Long-chain-alcohol oxidase n=1 Tax=Parascedosporium putredinis TaxID=1442378 RepID=A0A9P1HBL9_9PEZI|nr:unnamed protein product [Parascedosporium putredinis]CAI8005029.1 unnamed protein product [Parascedosporium putredinis]